eukprot:1302979-Rhodomonas_salina.3
MRSSIRALRPCSRSGSTLPVVERVHAVFAANSAISATLWGKIRNYFKLARAVSNLEGQNAQS